MKNKQKTIITFCLCFMLLSVVAYAIVPDLGNLSYWYSDEALIGKWLDTPSIYSTSVESSPNSATVASWVSIARTQWANARIATTTTTSSSTASINVYAGKLNSLRPLCPNLDQFSAGYTETTRSTYGKYHYQGIEKTRVTISKGKVYICTDLTSYPATVAVHEIGHALGWIGHTTDSTSVMNRSASPNNVLTTIDKNHISQIQ